ncbi:hypothetical protein [Kosakonia oryziphila]|uniref:hypothetical protein n=1 Tax=Kosakonia oryziphila TaxID=1005667 RepID=UPI000A5B50DC
MATFNTTLHEMQMDNAKLVDFLGHEPHTPLIEAVRTTSIGLSCINRALTTRS